MSSNYMHTRGRARCHARAGSAASSAAARLFVNLGTQAAASKSPRPPIRNTLSPGSSDGSIGPARCHHRLEIRSDR